MKQAIISGDVSRIRADLKARLDISTSLGSWAEARCTLLQGVKTVVKTKSGPGQAPSQDQVQDPRTHPAIDDRQASNSQYQNPIIRRGLDWSLQQWQCAANLTNSVDEKQRWTRGAGSRSLSGAC